MNRLRLFGTCFGFFCSILLLVGEARYELTIDATRQPSPPARGRGPFPGSALPGHSAGFPVRLDLLVPSEKLKPGSSMLIDFVITNTGSEPIELPVSVDQNMSHTQVLTLYLTSDAIVDRHFSDSRRIFPITPTSAELYGRAGDPQTLYALAPRKAIRVRASTRFELKPGTHALTGHAELVELLQGRSTVVGTAESIPVAKMISEANPAAR